MNKILLIILFFAFTWPLQAKQNHIPLKKNFVIRDAVLSATCETPASLACVYGLTANVPGCTIQGTTALPTGGWGAIAVVGYDFNTGLGSPRGYAGK